MVAMRTLAIGICAVVLGLLIGHYDAVIARGDDSQFNTLAYIILASATLGASRPRQAWLWGVLIGLGVPLSNLVVHGVGFAGGAKMNPLVGASLISALCMLAGNIGAYGGVLLRKIGDGSDAG
jgi:ABC-type amino acid transport system permease subunit